MRRRWMRRETIPGGGGAGGVFGAVQHVLQTLGDYDLQGDPHQRLHEAVLHRLAQVEPRVAPGQRADQKTLLGADEPLLGLDLQHNPQIENAGLHKEGS